MRRYWYKQTGVWINFSPRFLDILVKQIDGLPIDAGTWDRLVLSLAANVGCCTEGLLENNTNLPITEYRDPSVITQAMRDEAAKYKIPGFVRVPSDPLSIRNAMYLYEALTGTFIIGDEFWTKPDGTFSEASVDIDPLRTPKTIVSGHQMSDIGWDSPTLNLVRNQWGLGWGNNDENHYDPVLWQPFLGERWAIAEVPNDLKSFLKQLPSPTNFHYNWQRNLKRGDYNIDIGMVQVAYMILGYLAPLTADEFGHFGPKMALANYKYQVANKISPSSDDVGPKTRAALNAKFTVHA